MCASQSNVYFSCNCMTNLNPTDLSPNMTYVDFRWLCRIPSHKQQGT